MWINKKDENKKISTWQTQKNMILYIKVREVGYLSAFADWKKAWIKKIKSRY